jgi:hypothetical protein
MPQAPAMLSNMFEDDGHAWDFLRGHFSDDCGVIRKNKSDYAPTRDQLHAIDYLCLEWDYGYEPAAQ